MLLGPSHIVYMSGSTTILKHEVLSEPGSNSMEYMKACMGDSKCRRAPSHVDSVLASETTDAA
jgi:hypothetical protein